MSQQNNQQNNAAAGAAGGAIGAAAGASVGVGAAAGAAGAAAANMPPVVGLGGTTTSGQWQVMAMGVPLSENPAVAGLMVACEVDMTMYLPSQFKIVFRGNPDDVLLPAGLQLAVPVDILASDMTPLLSGEVTAVEVEYAHGETLTIVRGMDRSHRLMHGTQTMAYPDMTASDVVTMLVTQAELIPGLIEPTTYTYPWLTQANVSNWDFIQQLAALENYVAYTDGLGVFNFCSMPLPEEGEPPAMTYDVPDVGTQLVMGKNLLNLRAVVSAAEQVPEVTVTGYDPVMSAPVVGPWPAVPAVSQSLDPATLPPAVAEEFGATPFFDASRPFVSEQQAVTRAGSIASDIAGSLTEVEGECIGNPMLIAGSSITIGMAGQPFDGYYICTGARHVFDPQGAGYTTWITVGGYRNRSLYALSSGADSGLSTRPTIPGLVIGTVVNNEDPEEMGQVQVMFPWLSPDYVSAWARVMQIGASEVGSGFLWMPEVGDEVLLGFDRGCVDYPYVIGGLYNGIARPEPPPAVEGVVANRRIASRMAHTIQWNDGPDAMGISIMTAPAEDPPLSVQLDAEEMQISINAQTGQVQIIGAVGVSISSEAEISITSEGMLSMTGTSISIGDATTTDLSIAAAAVTISGPEGAPAGSISVNGATVSLGPA